MLAPTDHHNCPSQLSPTPPLPTSCCHWPVNAITDDLCPRTAAACGCRGHHRTAEHQYIYVCRHLSISLFASLTHTWPLRALCTLILRQHNLVHSARPGPTAVQLMSSACVGTNFHKGLSFVEAAHGERVFEEALVSMMHVKTPPSGCNHVPAVTGPPCSAGTSPKWPCTNPVRAGR